MTASVFLGLSELFTYWGLIYLATGMWWVNLTIRFSDWIESYAQR